MNESTKTGAGKNRAAGTAKGEPRDEATKALNRELRSINDRLAELKDLLKSGKEERKTLAARKSELKGAAGRAKP